MGSHVPRDARASRSICLTGGQMMTIDLSLLDNQLPCFPAVTRSKQPQSRSNPEAGYVRGPDAWEGAADRWSPSTSEWSFGEHRKSLHSTKPLKINGFEFIGGWHAVRYSTVDRARVDAMGCSHLNPIEHLSKGNSGRGGQARPFHCKTTCS